MARFMCFRPIKKHQDSDAYGSLKKNFNANVAPYNRMVVRSPLEEGLTLHYLTSKLIVLSSPDEGTERAYSESLKSITLTLKTKHYGHFKVWNVSRSRHDLTRCLLAEDYGWPACLAPPLDRLCVLCKQFEQWLTSHTDNVVVIHCKGDRSRAAIVVSSYLHYNAMCSDDDTIEDRCNIQQFVDKYIGGNGQPSHKRYITYFSSLLSGRIRVNSSPVYLKRITISHLVGRLIFLKIYERLDPVYQTQTVTCKDVTRFDVDQELRLRGDVLIKCYQVIPESRSVLFYCQINTCALELSRKEFNLTFYKEQLDSIFSDPSIDNRVAVTISISQDPPKTISIRKPLAETRSNSYENFSLSEDDPNPAVEYSVIQKKSSIVPKDTEELDKETDNWSSQNGVDSERKSTVQGTQSTMPPPPVPPKPRSASALAEPTNDIPERRGVLPAQVRPLIHRPPSPREGRATPSIEPDLVGKDRYDKASKCFSYAPTKALNEAFDKPRRPSFSRTVERKEEEIQNVNPEEVINAPIHATDIVRVTETPKWDDEVEKAKQVALLNELAHVPTHTQSATSQSYYMRNEVDDREERPIVVEQAQRATTTTTTSSAPGWNKRRQTKYGSYRTLNDESYNSDMDDLCDPDFYLNYSTSAMKAIPKPPERAQHVGTKSVELPRKKFEPVETFTDPLDDILLTSGSVPAASCMDLRERDSFRGRNCRSVAALPLTGRDKKLFAEHYDALSEAKDPDDWLTHKLRKVRSKREMDPDLIRRRTRERMLLEELKHAHDEKEVSRARVEADYSVEGMGTRSIDPLTEYRREEERLKNTHSPFDDIPRRNRQVRGKPPTPPPRDRSRSPARSERATPSLDVVKNNNYSSHRHQNGVTESEEFDFSNLSNTVKNNSAYPSRIEPRFDSRMEPCRNEYRLGPPDFYTDSRPLQRRQSFGLEKPPFQHNENTISGRPDTPTKFQSGQERVAAAIYRAETPQKEAYSSGTTQKTELSNRYFPENSTFVQRSETPAFPVTRETPIPYHPLLYSNNGSSRQDLERDRSNTLNYRSSSPRSQYYGQMSRRSSLTSVDTSEIIHHHPVFVKDTSKYWYKPTITREQAIGMLRDKAPGTFVVRDSNSFHGAFGLALKVATPPPGVMPGDGTELVRHFLIEPSPKGVKLKGCNNEPVFGSLSALVYQHSITPLALPTRLLLPEFDPATTPEHISATQALLEQGAACNVAYIGSVDVESLTGSECVRRATGRCIEDTQRRVTRPVSVHFKVSSQGVTLTDNTRKVFFRRHFPVNSVIYAGMDPAERRFDNYCVIGFHDSCVKSARLFAFVARKPSLMENACYVFAEFEPEQPASAVVNFINKVMLANRRG